MKIFVYGTLRQGEKNAYLLNKATCLFKNAWVEGSLHDTGCGYPAMFLQDNHNTSKKVYGEIYDVDRDMLSVIDGLEGYVSGRADNLYERVAVKAYTEHANMPEEVITYTAGHTLRHCNANIIPDDWKVYTYLLGRSEVYYFAYGSCMDDERFKQAHVDHFFTDVVGRGILNGYEMQFSKSTRDGGKADIVECADSVTEGIIYKAPFEALDYLYKREGVYTGGYRPVIVRVASGREQYEMLTFSGMNKQPETAPTSVYATEIIRGANGVLSETYVEQLNEKIANLIQMNGWHQNN